MDAGRPIIVGTSYESGHTGNNDATTDHFIVITGRGYDANRGIYYYIYMETGSSVVDKACDAAKNRLYYDDENYTFCQENYRNMYPAMHVTHVRPNDGNTEGTISQLNLNF